MKRLTEKEASSIVGGVKETCFDFTFFDSTKQCKKVYGCLDKAGIFRHRGDIRNC